MEYLGNVVPFYVSRYRLKTLEEKLRAGRYTLTGSVSVPGVGKLTFDRKAAGVATTRTLERVLTFLANNDAIGDAWDEDRAYTWVSLRASVIRIADGDKNVDHLAFADWNGVVPEGWRCLLIGARANLVSLEKTALPALGSSPLAIQWALEYLRREKRTKASHNADDCSRLRAGVKAATRDPAGYSWKVAGVVEIVDRCPDHRLLLGAPLFLTYHG